MSDIVFHKSCYTSRSPGYKYRTLATNTGEKKRRDSKEDNVFDTKFKELRRAIVSRVDKHFGESQRARDSIFDKFDKIDSKINTMLELQNTVKVLRKNLWAAENILADVQEKVNKLSLDLNSSTTTTFTDYPRKEESLNVISSTITHI
ncbi:uncharacterized protein LOC126372574 [Pectinophora gossypiella]|uniref:uncharacterized protein LOC126372574 n=1 Tax=Pectinophora gossypiella TaxID=13191 RepID=UPI00214F398D|nr:uncharacterized protein LOC126372574 [Pectinophora gossypiella]